MGLLSAHDLASSTWAKLKQHYELRLATLREQNDNPGSDTELLRGKIAEVKHLLALGDPPPPKVQTVDFDHG